MRTIRFWTSQNCRDGESWRWRLFLPEGYRLVYDETAPEYLFVSEHLYVDAARMRRFFELNDGSRLVVWHNGEAIFPDLNLVDYAYVFDRDAALGDRVCRIPTDAYFDVDERFGERETVEPKEELRRKTGFCSFIYGNPHAHPRRDQLFHLLNGWKRVDALGPHLNNCGNRPSRTDGDWHRKLVAEKRPYKFSIASENAMYPGYVSEKLTSSFRAHTVPIYWGDPTVAAEYNPEAFINANGMSDAEVLAAVKRVDSDDGLWMRMVASPYKTAEQFARSAKELERVKGFALKVFDERPVAAKKRAPSGYWNGIYRCAVARQFAAGARRGIFGRLFK